MDCWAYVSLRTSYYRELIQFCHCYQNCCIRKVITTY